MNVHQRKKPFAVALLAFCVLANTNLYAGVDHTFQLDTAGWQVQPDSVHVAGSFNNWSTSATPMQVNGGRLWSVTVNIEEGNHTYKFVVDQGTANQRWINDPKAEKELEVSDGHGGVNSGVIVGTDPAKLPPAKPNHINIEAIRFDPNDPLDLSIDEAGATRLRVRAQADDVQMIRVRVIEFTGSHPAAEQDSKRERATLVMRKVGSERGLDVFAATYQVPDLAKRHAFLLVAQDGSAYHQLNHLPPARPIAEAIPQAAAINVPAWTFDATWYQIFVERFRNGDPSNDPGDFSDYERLVPWNGSWFKPQPGEAPGMENFYQGAGNVWQRRFGGDIAGITEKLPYLRSLGVNALYLNPVFEAESMHKYDTADFRHIDDNFGVRDASPSTSRDRQEATNASDHTHAASLVHTRGSLKLGNRELFNLDGTPVSAGYEETDDPATWKWTKSDLLFLDFLKDAREQGFRVVIDGVFNHTGRAHPFFMDVLAKGKHSKYADWFEITDWGDEKNWKPMADPFAVHGKPGGIRWRAWDRDDGHLPVFKKDAERGLAKGPYEHIMAIAKRWLDPDGDPSTRDGVDGWRLDVPGDIPHPFWIDFRKVCREANPEAYIVGEIWSPAQAWVNKGDQFDAVMNYQFAMACQDFFVNDKKQIKPSAFSDRLVKLWFMYPHASALAMQNLFDSHDTDRAASMFVNPDRPYDGQNRNQDNAKDNPYSDRAPNETEWCRFLQMVAFQHAFIGAPMTYYGNEFGMWSSDDPNNRQPLPWDDKGPYPDGVGFNPRVFATFQRYIAIRNALPALRTGTFYPIKVDDDANVYGFARELDGKPVYIILNRSDKAREIALEGLMDGSYVDFADPASVKIEMPMIEIATKRPVPVVADSAKRPVVKDNKLVVSLPAYGVAILSGETGKQTD